MIHTCGEIICPLNPSLTGGIVLVQHESSNTGLMEPVTPATLSQRDTSLIILTPHKRLTLRGENYG